MLAVVSGSFAEYRKQLQVHDLLMFSETKRKYMKLGESNTQMSNLMSYISFRTCSCAIL